MRRIFIIFSESDESSAALVARDVDLVIGDLAHGCKAGILYFPELTVADQLRLTGAVAATLSAPDTDSPALLPGFANAYYECTVMPIARYIAALRSAIETLIKSAEPFEVVFPRKLLLQKETSAYYMSEYELQGVRLYSREAVFQPYLLRVCKERAATVRFARGMRVSPVHWFDPLRAWSVLAVRFFSALAAWRPGTGSVQYGAGARAPAACDIVSVSRSPAQTEVMSPFLRSTGLRACMIAAESFFAKGANWEACTQLAAAAPGTIGAVRLRPPPLGRLLGVYARSAWRVLVPKKQRLDVLGVPLDITQSLRELAVMLPDLLLYADALQADLSSIPRPEWGVLLTFEQKSPHALADAVTARKLGLKCIQVMQCDQYAHALPFPVFGDWFLADSRTNEARFREVWGADAARVAYVGSFKACADSVEQRPATVRGSRPEVWCFFANYDVELNRRVLVSLREAAAARRLDVMVKLHPRDSRERYRQFSDFRIVAEGDLSKAELFSSFTHAITFPSGIVLDLLFSGKPYLLLNFGGVIASEKFIYGDSRYAGLVGDLEALDSALAAPESLAREFGVFRQQLMKRNRVVDDAAVIKTNLMALLGLTAPAEDREHSRARTIHRAL